MIKTILCDIDGTLMFHHGNIKDLMKEEPVVLDGTLEKIDEWNAKGYNIILVTGRKESLRSITVNQLEKCGIIYDQLIMGLGGGQRVLINDLKPNPENPNNPTAVSFNVVRNEGIKNIEV